MTIDTNSWGSPVREYNSDAERLRIKRILQDENASEEDLLFAATHFNFAVRLSVAFRPNLTEKVMLTLAADESEMIRANIVGRKDVTLEMLKLMLPSESKLVTSAFHVNSKNVELWNRYLVLKENTGLEDPSILPDEWWKELMADNEKIGK